MNITQIEARLTEISTELTALSELNKETGLDEVQAKLAEDLNAEVDSLTASLKAAKEAQAKIDAKIAELKARDNALIETHEPTPEPEVAKLPACVRGQKSRHFETPQDAFTSAQYLAHLTGSRSASEFLAAQSVGTDDKGGFTVPDPLSNALINLLEEHGVARRACKRVVMSALTWTVPKLVGHATVYYPDEAASITESDLTFGQVQLIAKKLAGLVKMSTEVTEDSIISMMDVVVQSLAYGIAIEEDKNLFLGVSGGVNEDGIKGDASVADTNVASVATMALTDLNAVTVSVGNPIIGARNEWYLNSTMYNGPIRDLLNAAPGNTASEYAAGSRPTLLGYPVNYVNVLPGANASGAGELLGVFGDLSLGCYFGDRRALNFKTLNELYAETDQVGVQCTERIDIKVANPEVIAKLTITG